LGRGGRGIDVFALLGGGAKLPRGTTFAVILVSASTLSDKPGLSLTFASISITSISSI
jgi:hypothetical protein